jgi:hypothetical protein
MLAEQNLALQERVKVREKKNSSCEYFINENF